VTQNGHSPGFGEVSVASAVHAPYKGRRAPPTARSGRTPLSPG